MSISSASVPNGDSALRAWRKARGLTLEKAAELVPTSHSVWLRWERRERLPRGRSLQRIAAATGLTSDQILDLAPYEPSTDRAGPHPDRDPAGATLAEEGPARASSASFRKAG